MDRNRTMRWIAACAAGLVTSLLAGCNGPRPTDQSIAYGNHYLEYEKWQEAADEFKPVLEHSPGNWRAEYGYGVAMTNLGDLPAARSALERANARMPSNMDVVFALAQVMYQQKDASQLYQLLQGSASEFGSQAAYLKLAEYAMELKDNDTALMALQGEITVDEGFSVDRSTEPYLRMAQLQEQIGNRDEAVRRLRQAYAIQPLDPRVIAALEAQGMQPGPGTALSPEA